MIRNLLICLILIGASHADAAEDNSTLYLLEKIAELEARIEALENPRSGTSSVPAGLAAWRRLEIGMSPSQVRQILGEPKKIDSGYYTRWYYGFGTASYSPERVDFIQGQGVTGWEEP
jgi:hypothetical protein